jgi:hypothetical protein
MNVPALSKIQQKLRGKNISDMTNAELPIWIEACRTMEKAKLPMKARRSWKEVRIAAEAEMRRRGI